MKERIQQLELHPAKILAIGFAGVILIGSLLLSLPFVTQSGERVPYVDALFTATSAVCVTGLVTVTTAEVWNTWGHIIIIMLIQIGGLGVMSTATIAIFLTGAKFSLTDRHVLKEAFDETGYSGVIRLAKYILLLTLAIESIGAVVLSFSFIPMYGVVKGVWYSIFHSVSAFCNAGFDIIGPSSLKPLQTHGMITLPIAMLIMFGGLGFGVILDLLQYHKTRSLKLHSKFVLLMTVILIVFGAVAFFFAEYNNPLTFGPLAFIDKLENALFQSITPRTAGYASINQWEMTSQSQGLTMLLMFIGGSPGSTAGGIKTVTFGLMIALVVSVVRGRDETEIFHRRIDRSTINRAIALVIIGLAAVIIPVLLLTTLNPELAPSLIAFETVSAFATVGLGAGITPLFTTFSKLVLIVTMFIGRVGPLTLLYALAEKARRTNQLRYPEGRIHIG